MSKLDLVLVTAAEVAALKVPGEDQTGTGLEAETHRLRSENLDRLLVAWPLLMERLRAAVEKDIAEEKPGSLRLESVEFQIGFEAGWDMGFAAKANAAATVTFKRG